MSLSILASILALARNYLRSAIGDHINLLMAACAWNMKQWLLAIFLAVFPNGEYGKNKNCFLKLPRKSVQVKK